MKNQFFKYCTNNKFEQNDKQIRVLDFLISFHKENFIPKSIFFKLFNKFDKKLGFYLHGDVGVGKTMLLNFFFSKLKISKRRIHFNEFMINFHNFRHDQKIKQKDNSIAFFVKSLKQKIDLIYLDEFQVTNIVDAMILGKLFETIFKENIKVLITSNVKINDLYKDGLQRDQFLPFIKVIKKFCVEHKLVIDQDYRMSGESKLERFFYLANERSSFQLNQTFRQLTKGKKSSIIKLNIKGRVFTINLFFEGIASFDFKELCDVNTGAEDYIAEKCNFLTLLSIPNFNDNIVDQQQRFITLIDILYEKKIPMMISAHFNQNNFSSSAKLIEPYKRTLSRLFELTSPNFLQPI